MLSTIGKLGGYKFWEGTKNSIAIKRWISMSKVLFTTKVDLYNFRVLSYETTTTCTLLEDMSLQNYNHVYIE